jgi:hypothetical protein
MRTRGYNEVEFKLAIQVASGHSITTPGSGRSLGRSLGWANSFPCPTPVVAEVGDGDPAQRREEAPQRYPFTGVGLSGPPR